MNFLAHAVLSFGDPGLLTGNMISDFIKGRKKFELPPQVLAGVELHRAIDNFTDEHPVNKDAKKVFAPDYRLYASSILDIVYDHFVANDPLEWKSNSLEMFTDEVYRSLQQNADYFPEKFAAMFPYMRSQNWLLNYRSEDGIWQSLGGLKRRALYITETATAFSIFLSNKEMLRSHYSRFFPELKAFATREAGNLKK